MSTANLQLALEAQYENIVNAISTDLHKGIRLTDEDKVDGLKEDIFNETVKVGGHDISEQRIKNAVEIIDKYFATAGASLLVEAYENGYAGFVNMNDTLAPRIIHAQIDRHLLRKVFTEVLSENGIDVMDFKGFQQLVNTVLKGYQRVFNAHVDSIPGKKDVHWSALTGKDTDNEVGITFYTPHPADSIDDVQSKQHPIDLIAGVQELIRDLNIDSDRTYYQTDVGIVYLTAHLMGTGMTADEARIEVADTYDVGLNTVRKVTKKIDIYLPSSRPRLDYRLTPESHEKLQSIGKK